ncbi:MAG: hypothetical protein Q7S52_00620 [bacterium]|nr:hypothetical protein [bacterium]
MSKFARFFLAVIAGFSFGISSAHAMHKDDPIIYMSCDNRKDAEAVINVFVNTILTKGGTKQFDELLQNTGLTDRCGIVNTHVSDFEQPVQDLIRADTPTLWSGPMLADAVAEGAWPYVSWHLEAITSDKGTPGETTHHLVIIKKAFPPTQ